MQYLTMGYITTYYMALHIHVVLTGRGLNPSIDGIAAELGNGTIVVSLLSRGLVLVGHLARAHRGERRVSCCRAAFLASGPGLRRPSLADCTPAGWASCLLGIESAQAAFRPFVQTLSTCQSWCSRLEGEHVMALARDLAAGCKFVLLETGDGWDEYLFTGFLGTTASAVGSTTAEHNPSEFLLRQLQWLRGEFRAVTGTTPRNTPPVTLGC